MGEELGREHVPSSQRRNDRMVRTYRLVSGDSHLQVPADFWTDRLPQRYRDLAPRRVKIGGGGEAIVAADGSKYFGATGSYAGHSPEDFDPTAAFDYDKAVGSGPPAQRLREQDRDGVDAELLFPGTSATHGIRVKESDAYLAMVRGYNEYLADYCAEAPDRLFGVGLIPSAEIDVKIAEMERLKEMGIRAVGLLGYPAGETFPTPEDDRFWAAASDIEMPLCIHTSMSRSSGRLFRYPRVPESGNLEDDFINRLYRHANASRCGSLTACQMVFDGLFHRFPSLKIYWAENNIGWIPFYLEQMDAEYEKNHHWAERLFGIPRLDAPPSEYIKEHAYWGFYDDPIGIKLRHEIGVDHVIWGSDFPHVVCHWPGTQELLDKQMAGVADDEKHEMLAGNLIDFLHLEVEAETSNA
ncbi:MAG: amidohydrolase family protein [Chloroflexi bacterium]|nr:amidohydrolase family protein [Chloroflexota bacterium]